MTVIYKTTANGVYKTENAGGNWSDITPASGFSYVDMTESKRDEDHNVYVMANGTDASGNRTGTIWKSDD